MSHENISDPNQGEVHDGHEIDGKTGFVFIAGVVLEDNALIEPPSDDNSLLVVSNGDLE